MITVRICVHDADFARLEPAWEALLEQLPAQQSRFFLSFDWMFHWWESYRKRLPAAELRVLTAQDENDQLVGILPLYGRRSGRFPLQLRTLHLLGTQFEAPEHLDLLARPEMAPAVAAEMVQFLFEKVAPGYDALILTDLAEKGHLIQAVSDYRRKKPLSVWRKPWMVCPFVEIEGEFAAYLQQRSANTRYNLRRRTRRLRRDFQTEFQVAGTAPEISSGMQTLMDLHRKRWKSHREESTFDNPQSQSFHRELARRLAEKNRVRLFTLCSNGTPVAALFGYLHNRRFVYYQAGFDPAFRQYSVGMILLANILEFCFREKYVEFDFLRGLEPYKFKWTEKSRQTWCLEVALTRRARRYFQLKHRVGRIKSRLRTVLQRWQKLRYQTPPPSITR